jgi:hypothetical protein
MALVVMWAVIATIMASSCTLSYQNICTHGTTENVADDEQTASPKIDAQATVSGVIPKLQTPTAVR